MKTLLNFIPDDAFMFSILQNGPIKVRVNQFDAEFVILTVHKTAWLPPGIIPAGQYIWYYPLYIQHLIAGQAIGLLAAKLNLTKQYEFFCLNEEQCRRYYALGKDTPKRRQRYNEATRRIINNIFANQRNQDGKSDKEKMDIFTRLNERPLFDIDLSSEELLILMADRRKIAVKCGYSHAK